MAYYLLVTMFNLKIVTVIWGDSITNRGIFCTTMLISEIVILDNRKGSVCGRSAVHARDAPTVAINLQRARQSSSGGDFPLATA